MAIKYRFFLLVLAFALLASGIVGMSIRTMDEYDTIMDEYREAYENALLGERINRLISNAVTESRGIYLSRNAAEARQFADGLNISLGQIDSLLRTWQTDPEAARLGLTSALITDIRNFNSQRRQVARMGLENRPEAALAIGEATRLERKELQARIDDLTARMKAHLILTETRLQTLTQQRQQAFIAIAAASVLIMVAACALMIRHFIQQPLQALAKSIVRISEGDFETQIPQYRTESDLGHVWNALRVLKDRSMEAERLHREQHLAELKMRELTLD